MTRLIFLSKRLTTYDPLTLRPPMGLTDADRAAVAVMAGFAAIAH